MNEYGIFDKSLRDAQMIKKIAIEACSSFGIGIQTDMKCHDLLAKDPWPCISKSTKDLF